MIRSLVSNARRTAALASNAPAAGEVGGTEHQGTRGERVGPTLPLAIPAPNIERPPAAVQILRPPPAVPVVVPSPVPPAARRPVVQDPYAPLRLYDGAWRVRRADGGVDRLVNRCARVGRYFTCEQTANDTVRALVTFIPADTAGRYATQAVLPNGAAVGRGALVIDGARWTYDSRDSTGGRTTHYRTVNVFTGRDRIHFEVARSDDGVHWTTTLAGDEERAVSPPPAAPGPPPA
ncbi:hypothetical protein tb265_17110 [Gemmatimonadetes bacterium T265]|nr:hypothetical protein tb265_17110 [Gemmatimonadetes bacterium T265]